ncbi:MULTISPECIES: hypothetical protein [Paenibacillus]|uniref:hypothetical protein n=1 Tax=Paenibacillus TaxID=44249 RepID=UPI0009FED4AC|nr:MULTISPECIES: hypothetical protein [Paenibacillus]
MKNKFLKIVGTTTLAISLITGASSAVLANADTASKEGNKAIEITPYAIKDTLTWDLLGNKTDPTNSFSVTIGAPNIKLYAKNTGTASFRVEVKHNSKNTVIFNETISADGTGKEFINNDSNPLVPSGTYTVTIYGGSGLPKGQIVLKSSDTKW